jgi:Rha family phage regulatory protein
LQDGVQARDGKEGGMNECVDSVLTELSAVGIEPTVEQGRKHIKIEWEHHGSPRTYVTATTPSDRRAHLNVRADVRRMLRLDGLIGDETLPVQGPALQIRGGAATVSSLDIARHFDKAHKDVLRSIDRIIEETGQEFGGRNFTLSSYITEQSKQLRCFDMTRDGFALLVMGFTGPSAMQWKLKYIEAFNAMEAEILASRAPVESRLAALEADLAAMTDLFLQECAPPRIIRSAGFTRIKPCIRNKWLGLQ